MDEVRALLASGIPETAHPFTGLVYRQALELLKGVRDESATRELIVRENRRYARRQLIWFRKEPNLQWIYAAGEREDTRDEVARLLARLEKRSDGHP
jgi:tRNA dimethylallyltransferase